MVMNKKILHITKYYYPDEGGIETVAKYLAEGLSNYTNLVVGFSSDSQDRHDVINGVEVTRIASSLKIASQDISFSYYSKLKRLIKEYEPDAILLHCPNPYLYPIIKILTPRRCKLVMLWHSDILMKGILYKLVSPVEKWLLSRANLVLVTSPNMLNSESPIFGYSDKVRILPNGIVSDDFELKEGDAERIETIKNTYDNKKIVFFVGRHIPYKGLEYLVKSERFVKSECSFIIAGRGEQTGYLKSLSDSERIHFIGKINNDELRCYYHAADVFAFPSITRQEAFGVALAEAMYCECATVTFHLSGSGVNWVSLKNITGEEVELKNVGALANAIDHILSNPELCRKYQENGKKRVKENFTDKNSVKIADKIFSDLLKDSSDN